VLPDTKLIIVNQDILKVATVAWHFHLVVVPVMVVQAMKNVMQKNMLL